MQDLVRLMDADDVPRAMCLWQRAQIYHDVQPLSAKLLWHAL